MRTFACTRRTNAARKDPTDPWIPSLRRSNRYFVISVFGAALRALFLAAFSAALAATRRFAFLILDEFVRACFAVEVFFPEREILETTALFFAAMGVYLSMEAKRFRALRI